MDVIPGLINIHEICCTRSHQPPRQDDDLMTSGISAPETGRDLAERGGIYPTLRAEVPYIISLVMKTVHDNVHVLFTT